MRKKLTDMNPVDDFVTQNTPGLKIWDENWGGMQCAYHVFAPGTDFTQLLQGAAGRSVRGPAPRLRHQRHAESHLQGRERRGLQGWGRVLLARSAQLHLRRRGRDHPVQHLWRVG